MKQSMSFQNENTELSAFENILGYTFKNKELLIMSLTHSTFAYEHKLDVFYDNERLEFLGDGILDFVSADFLFRNNSKYDEGILSKTRALIVCEATLAEKAKLLGLGYYLRLGKGEELTGGRDKPSNLANALEAVFAAVYIDGGFEKARSIILHTLSDSIDKALSGQIVFDYKSKILEMAQTKGNLHAICFRIVEESGPVHEKIYTAAVLVDDIVIGIGSGHSKKLAEQEASKKAYFDWMIQNS